MILDDRRAGVSSDILKRLFGRPVRVHLALWVLDRDQSFYLQEAQVAMQQLAHAPSATRAEVVTLRDCGLLIETAIGGRKYYTPSNSSWWQVFRAIASAMHVDSADDR